MNDYHIPLKYAILKKIIIEAIRKLNNDILRYQDDIKPMF